MASLCVFSRSGGGSRVCLYRPESLVFGSKVDRVLFERVKGFCSDPRANDIDSIQRKNPEKVFKDRKECEAGSFTFVKWEYNVFPKNLMALISTNSNLDMYWSREMDTMLSPRLFEISDNLGNEGIAAVVEGKRYLFISYA
jgi:hypothetical protein